jgi:hypothetical protein
MEQWAIEGWTREGDWYIHRGSGAILFPAASTYGRFRFTVAPRNRLWVGLKRIQWVVNWVDAKNYVLFELDKKKLYRYAIVDTIKGEPTVKELPITEMKGASFRYTLNVEIGPGRVVHRIYDGKTWHVVDTWNSSGSDLTVGKFGFMGELSLSNFEFTPK